VRGTYRGRIAPTPTGYLHLGHAATFLTAFERARASRGALVYRTENLDPRRCKPEFALAAMEDLRWLGIRWEEGPHEQAARRAFYHAAWRRLKEEGFLYPCARSRKDVAGAALAPHEEEPIFPMSWRSAASEAEKWTEPGGVNWRFRVPEGETLRFTDGAVGEVMRTGQKDFGDFLVWNREDVPAYELAVVVDDIAMGITEVVRGEDLLTSTARQLLLYRALGAEPPRFFHCPLLRDGQGRRLAKRDAALSLRALRAAGWTPEDVRKATSSARGNVSPPPPHWPGC
jgi:glutamyl/glutaminyl-tRNA synthetase